MADIDTKVLYLETPPTSAPKTSYILGVRIKNVGIHARFASGYVQVFDKSTGLLVKTYSVASAEIDPGEEKQAFASEVWDLTDDLTGKQYILSGMVTSDGDMIPSNDILNPTTVTVADTPPPPPPAVTPHKSQHEDGGNDELDLTGLHGVLGTPQPYADHAAKHQAAGDDQLNVGGLAGALAEPQLPTDHANERHAVPFATEALLTNHENDNDTHDAADNLEKTAAKGQVDGYAELNGAGLVPHAQLAPGGGTGTKFLRDDSTFQVGTAHPLGTPVRLDLGESVGDGVSTDVARADHQHSQQGPISCAVELNALLSNATHNLITKVVGAGWCPPDADVMAVADIYGECYALQVNDVLQFDLRYGDTAAGTYPIRATNVITIAHPHDVLTWHVRLVCMKDGGFQFVGRSHGDFTDPGGGPAHVPEIPVVLGTPAFDTGLAAQMMVDLTLTGNPGGNSRWITTKLTAMFPTT
jgi:hypothetical protein